jgi:hypothetical protein
MSNGCMGCNHLESEILRLKDELAASTEKLLKATETIILLRAREDEKQRVEALTLLRKASE